MLKKTLKPDKVIAGYNNTEAPGKDGIKLATSCRRDHLQA
jgi:hypothetical protein